jgi:hypothetical protein
MATSGRGSGVVGYNVQVAVAAKKIFPCLFDRFDKISLREHALTNV